MPPPEPPRSARDVLLRSWAGRLFIVAVITKFLAALFRVGGEPPAFIQVLSSIATLAMATSLVYFIARLFIMIKRRLLWRVRRKLILSYIFIGVVPALLILFFFLLGAAVFSMNVSAYLFKDGYDDVIRDTSVLSDAAAVEIARMPASAAETIARVQRNGARTRNYASLSMLFLPAAGSKLARVSAGEWKHAPVPDDVPVWVGASGFEGTVVVPDSETATGTSLVIRSVKPALAGSTRLGYVVADVPVDGSLIDQLYETTGIRSAVPEVHASAPGGALAEGARAAAPQPDEFVLFGRSVAFFDAHEWLTGKNMRTTFPMKYRLSEIYGRLVTAQSAQVGSMSVAQAILSALILVAVLFLIIQMAALTMGLALARSITSSIHELFMGTERVRQGDFAHRIEITTKDQLGELADSFNQMTGSIENLLQTAAEKKRLEEELRIARQIQMSLLPRGPLEMPGLGVTALCVPAREVGGDYYDFFTARPRTGRHHHCRRVGEGHVRGVVHGGAQGSPALAQPDPPFTAQTAARGQPDHLRESRQPQLHHHDLCRPRSRQGRDDIRQGRPYAPHLPSRPGRSPFRMHRSSSRTAWSSDCVSTAPRKSSPSCSRKNRSR